MNEYLIKNIKIIIIIRFLTKKNRFYIQLLFEKQVCVIAVNSVHISVQKLFYWY